VRNMSLGRRNARARPDCERPAAEFVEPIYSRAEDPQRPVQLTDAEPYD